MSHDRSWLKVGRIISAQNREMLKMLASEPELIVQSRYKYVDCKHVYRTEQFTEWVVDETPEWFGLGEFRFMPPPVEVDKIYDLIVDHGKIEHTYSNVKVVKIDCRAATINTIGSTRVSSVTTVKSNFEMVILFTMILKIVERS